MILESIVLEQVYLNKVTENPSRKQDQQQQKISNPVLIMKNLRCLISQNVKAATQNSKEDEESREPVIT